METKLYIVAILLFFTSLLNAQIGGEDSFEFLNLTQSSRVTALGGQLVSVADSDISLGYSNPATLNAANHGQLSVNHNFLFAGITHGFASGGFHHAASDITFHLGFNYINYGDFVRTDLFGNRTGEFDSGETAITIGAGKQLNERIRAGVNLKFANSSFDVYRAFAVAGDIGLLYENPESNFSVGIVAKNIGAPITNFTNTRESLPFDFQIGLSKRLKHLPFRLSITAHQLHRWNIRFDDANDTNTITFLGQDPTEQSGLSKEVDNFFRHFIFSGEFLIGPKENFKLRIGYNHLRKQELAVSEFRSLGGLSFGIGWQIRKFRFDYGVGYYHLAGAANSLSLAINLSEFGKKI